jgi:hypothetical protein
MKAATWVPLFSLFNPVPIFRLAAHDGGLGHAAEVIK